MKHFKVFCADCKIEYEQEIEKSPYCCGNCGSSWIAVKQIDPPACVRCGSPLNGQYCSDIACPFSDYPQNDFHGWIGHPDHEETCDRLERIEQMEILWYLRREKNKEDDDEL